MSREHETRESLFEQLAGAMALDGQAGAPAKELLVELGSKRLPPLKLPEVRRPQGGMRQPAVVGMFAMAAAVALMVLASRWVPAKELDFGYGIKGREAVRLYWERDGEVRRFDGAPLANGDRVLAEVLVPKPSLAYWGVLSAKGELLGDWTSVKASEMPLIPGKAATFPSSLKLVGANEGETLFVLVCNKDGPNPFPELSSNRGGGISDLAHCKSWKFQLR